MILHCIFFQEAEKTGTIHIAYKQFVTLQLETISNLQPTWAGSTPKLLGVSQYLFPVLIWKTISYCLERITTSNSGWLCFPNLHTTIRKLRYILSIFDFYLGTWFIQVHTYYPLWILKDTALHVEDWKIQFDFLVQSYGGKIQHNQYRN